jgi:hypothetical protein
MTAVEKLGDLRMVALAQRLRRLRKPVVRGLGAALLAAGMWTCASAWAIPVAAGTSCYSEGYTMAHGGTPNELADNARRWTSGCGNSIESRGQVDVLVDASSTNVHSFYQQSRASAEGAASIGTLHAASFSSAKSDPMRHIYTSSSGSTLQTDNAYRASASASITTEFHDVLTIGGRGNEAGFVVLQFTLALSGAASIDSLGYGKALITANLYIDDDHRPDIYHIASLNQAGSVSTTIGFRPGWSVQIQGVLSAVTEMRAGRECTIFSCPPLPGGYNADGLALANASNTAGIYIDVLTPTGTFASLSGASYVAPVPEPQSAWLFAFGALTMLVVASRARSAR